MIERCKMILALSLIFLLLPCLVTACISGREVFGTNRAEELEEYLPILVAMDIPGDFEEEAIKAQAVLVRTNLLLDFDEGKGEKRIADAVKFAGQWEADSELLKRMDVFYRACADTENEVLYYRDKLSRVPYHRISSGITRDGLSVLGEAYAHVPSVEAKRDLESEEYLSGIYFTSNELYELLKAEYPAFLWKAGNEPAQAKKVLSKEEIQILSVDDADYVLEIEVGNEVFQGETLRKCLKLPSACFTVELLGEEIRFLCKGIGHGVGVSQYAANEMAKEGKTYQEILHYFLGEMKIDSTEEGTKQ